jgi:hypothetical protein
MDPSSNPGTKGRRGFMSGLRATFRLSEDCGTPEGTDLARSGRSIIRWT